MVFNTYMRLDSPILFTVLLEALGIHRYPVASNLQRLPVGFQVRNERVVHVVSDLNHNLRSVRGVAVFEHRLESLREQRFDFVLVCHVAKYGTGTVTWVEVGERERASVRNHSERRVDVDPCRRVNSRIQNTKRSTRRSSNTHLRPFSRMFSSDVAFRKRVPPRS